MEIRYKLLCKDLGFLFFQRLTSYLLDERNMRWNWGDDVEIHLVAKDEIEAQGIRWIIESHLTGVRLILWKTIEEFEKGIRNQQPEFVILDMDIWTDESEAMGVSLKRREFDG